MDMVGEDDGLEAPDSFEEQRRWAILDGLSQDVRELSLGTSGEVQRVKGPLQPLEFLREFVMPGRPCVITDAIEHWAALHRWSNEYLCKVLKHQRISLHFTPDGRADALVNPSDSLSSPGCSCSFPTGVGDKHGTEKVFVSAHVEELPFPRALDYIVGNSGRPGVAYAQQQNGCFTSEYGLLAADADAHIAWATEALGCMPEAVNLWIGNEKSVTSFHKDHYENLYAVITGEKHFTLLPPTDMHRMYIRRYPAAHYARVDSGKLVMKQDIPITKVPWVSVDPFPGPSDLQEAHAMFPRYFGGPKPFECTVRAGELLYLPSMWFHHVRQTPDWQGRTIALNYWYDMQFDIKYAYFNLLQSLAPPL